MILFLVHTDRFLKLPVEELMFFPNAGIALQAVHIYEYAANYSFHTRPFKWENPELFEPCGNTDILEMVAHLYVTWSLNQFQSIQLPYTDSAEEAVLDKTGCTATVTSALQRRSIVASQILVRSRGIYTHKVLSVLLVVLPSFKNHIQAEQSWEHDVQRLQHT